MFPLTHTGAQEDSTHVPKHHLFTLTLPNLSSIKDRPDIDRADIQVLPYLGPDQSHSPLLPLFNVSVKKCSTKSQWPLYLNALCCMYSIQI